MPRSKPKRASKESPTSRALYADVEAKVLSYDDITQSGSPEVPVDNIPQTQMLGDRVQGALHMQEYAHKGADQAAGNDTQGPDTPSRPPRTPPPEIPAHAFAGASSQPSKHSPPATSSPSFSLRKHVPTPQRFGTPMFEDSVNDRSGGDESLNISMLSSSSASAATSDALMITMGKMRKKEGHGILAKERPVDCWIEDNVFKVRGEDDTMAESWDLAHCKVVPPHKLDRIKLRSLATNSGTKGLRELSLHAQSTFEAQQWLRTIVSRQEIIRVQNECSAILKRVQDVQERKNRQLCHQIEILTHTSETQHDTLEGLRLEITQWQSKYNDMRMKYENALQQAQALEEEVRLAQLTIAAHAEDAEAKIEEMREGADAQAEALLERLQELQEKSERNKILASSGFVLVPLTFVDSVEQHIEAAMNVAELLDTQVRKCLFMADAMVKVPDGRFETRTKEQQQVIEDLTMKNNAVHNGCREALLKLNSLQVKHAECFRSSPFRSNGYPVIPAHASFPPVPSNPFSSSPTPEIFEENEHEGLGGTDSSARLKIKVPLPEGFL